MNLPKIAGSVIESEGGTWFVLYPPDEWSHRWEWLSAGGDHFFTDYDKVKRIISTGSEIQVALYGYDEEQKHATGDFE